MTAPRRALRVLGGLAAALLLAVLVGEVMGWPFLRLPLQQAVARGSGVPVDLQGRFRLHLLWRPRLEVGQLRVAAVNGFQVPYLVDAQGLSLACRWRDLWRWRHGEALRVQRLQAAALKAHLVRAADGRATWQLGAPRQPRPADEEKATLGLPRFGSLTVENGHIIVRDRLLDVDMDVRVEGREGDSLQDNATAGYEARLIGRYKAMPLKLEVVASRTLPLLQDPEGTGPELPWVVVRVEGSIGASSLLFDGRAAALMGDSKLTGQIRFKGSSLADVGDPLGVTLPHTPPFELRGQLMHEANLWHLKADRAAIGTSELAGDLRYDGSRAPPVLSGKVMGPKLVFADLGPTVGAPAQAAPSASQGKVLPARRFDIPSLRAMDADVQFAIDELDFGTPAMEPLRQLRTRVRLDRGVLRLEDLQAAVAGGRVKGLTQLDGTRDPARWQAELKFADIDMAGWLRGMRSEQGRKDAPKATQSAAQKKQRQQAREGGDQPVLAYLTGALSGDFQVKGAGSSTAEILGSLDGRAHLMLRDGSLSHLATEALGLDVAQILGVLVRGDQPLPLRCARLDLAVDSGLVEPRLAVIDNKDSTVFINGKVDLKDESLALRAVTRPKDWSPLSLRTPITVGGTFASPSVGIEPKRLAGRVLGAIALGAAAGPAAAIIPLVEPGIGKDAADPCTQAPPAQAGASAPRSSKP